MDMTTTDDGATTIEDLHTDVILTHILSRLDGPALASTSCASSTLHSLSHRNRHLWSDICYSTWPSTNSPRIRNIISTFPPHGPRSFFSLSFPLILSTTTAAAAQNNPHHRPLQLSQLISAVDIHYGWKLIFSKLHETAETEYTDWFRSAPFRIDLLHPKDVILTPAQIPNFDDTCRELSEHLKLSWILIDPIRRTAVNLSSYKPVSVQRYWLSGEAHVRFDTILDVDDGTGESSSELVKCGIVVTCGGSEGGEMQVREVSLWVEDMDGMRMNGEDGSVILRGALEGTRGKHGEEGKRRYEEFSEKRRERRERKLKREGTLDMLCMAFGIAVFTAFWFYVLCT